MEAANKLRKEKQEIETMIRSIVERFWEDNGYCGIDIDIYPFEMVGKPTDSCDVKITLKV